MKLLLLLISLGVSGAIKAQVLAPNGVLSAVDTVKKQADLVATLQGSANLHYKVLTKDTPIYSQPADTAAGKYVRKLRKGTEVYILKSLPQGIMIWFEAGHNEEYCLPYSLIKGLPTYIGI
jgi:hypothetical protein